MSSKIRHIDCKPGLFKLDDGFDVSDFANIELEFGCDSGLALRSPDEKDLSIIVGGFEIGRLIIKDNVLSFSGDIDESAKLFIESVNKLLREG